MRQLLLGPPGTGKTTALLDIVEKHIERGVPPDRIAFVSFTNAAVDEAVARVKGKKPKWFRTLHSMGKEVTGNMPAMDRRDWRELEQVLGYSVTGKAGSRGEQIKDAESQSRSRMMPIREVAKLVAPDLNHYQIEQYAEVLRQYKATHGLCDFGDMLSRVRSALDVDVFIVDEAQDLTRLQWQAVRTLSENAEHVYFAGDDDQTIHAWAGSDIETFMGLGDEVDDIRVLGRSYRLPQSVHALADKIISRVSHRYQKQWAPRDAVGTVSRVALGSLPRLGLADGEWLLLARNGYLLEHYEEILQRLGLLYEVQGSLVHERYVRAIVTWERLRKGGELTHHRQIESLYRNGFGKTVRAEKGRAYRREDFGEDRPWYEVLRGVPSDVSRYLRVCLRNGERFDRCRIRLSTIHQAKGREAQNVVVMPDVSPSSKMVDDEHRVFYVGVTRAKENLFLLNPNSELFYRW